MLKVNKKIENLLSYPKKKIDFKRAINWTVNIRILLTRIGKILYVINYVYIISKKIYENMRKETCYSIPGSVSSAQDYTERLSEYFNLEIQSDHFGKGRFLSIKVFNI